MNVCRSALQGARRARAPPPSAPTTTLGLCRAISRGFHTGFLNARASSPRGPHACQACRSTAVQTQRAFTLPWLCTWGSLCQERSPSLPCSTTECPLRPGEPWAGRARPEFPGTARKVRAAWGREHPAMVLMPGADQQAKGHKVCRATDRCHWKPWSQGLGLREVCGS